MAKRAELTIVETGIPARFANQEGGLGLSKDKADNVVPLLYVLHPLSKVAQKSRPEYVPGAVGGSIWLRNAERPIISGDEGVLFQPCFFTKDWVEWISRDDGGGFVGRFKDVPEEAEPIIDKGRVIGFTLNGHELKETRYHYGIVRNDDGSAPMPYVIPLSGSGHAVSKNWMVSMNAKAGSGANSFDLIYRLRTKARSNPKGDWFVLDPSYERYATDDEALNGKNLFLSLSAGEKTAEDPLMRDDGEGFATTEDRI